MTKNRAPNFSMETVDGRVLRVAVWRASKATNKLPILFFNGIGANIEAMAPMAELLDDRDFMTFDMPGIGGSPDPVVPYNALLMSRAYCPKRAPNLMVPTSLATRSMGLIIPLLKTSPFWAGAVRTRLR